MTHTGKLTQRGHSRRPEWRQSACSSVWHAEMSLTSDSDNVQACATLKVSLLWCISMTSQRGFIVLERVLAGLNILLPAAMVVTAVGTDQHTRVLASVASVGNIQGLNQNSTNSQYTSSPNPTPCTTVNDAVDDDNSCKACRERREPPRIECPD